MIYYIYINFRLDMNLACLMIYKKNMEMGKKAEKKNKLEIYLKKFMKINL